MPTSNTTDHVFGGLFRFLKTSCGVPGASFRGGFFSRVRDFTFCGSLGTTYVSGAKGSVSTLVTKGRCGSVMTGLLRTTNLGCKTLPGKLLGFRQCTSNIHAPLRRRLIRNTLCTTNGAKGIGIRFAISARRHRLFAGLIRRGITICTGGCKIRCSISFSRRGPDASAITTSVRGGPFHSGNGLLFHPKKRNTLVRGLGSLSTSIVFVGGVSGIIPSHLGRSAIACGGLVTKMLIALRGRMFRCLRLLSNNGCARTRLRRVVHFLRRALYYHGLSVGSLRSTSLIVCLHGGLGHPVHMYNVIGGINRPKNNPFLTCGTSNAISLRVLRDSRVSVGSPIGGRVFRGNARFGPISLIYTMHSCGKGGFSLIGCISGTANFVSCGSGGNERLGTLRLPNL